MKVTLPMTFEIDDEHPLVRDAVQQAAVERARQLDEQVEAGPCCGQCDEPLAEENAQEGEMCRDCELEYTNPREWERLHRKQVRE